MPESNHENAESIWNGKGPRIWAGLLALCTLLLLVISLVSGEDKKQSRPVRAAAFYSLQFHMAKYSNLVPERCKKAGCADQLKLRSWVADEQKMLYQLGKDLASQGKCKTQAWASYERVRQIRHQKNVSLPTLSSGSWQAGVDALSACR